MAWGIREGRRDRGGAAWMREVGPDDLGVDGSAGAPPYRERPGDTALERALGGAGPLVVVAGARRAGTSRATARAARALLGDHLVVGHHDAPDAGVGDLAARAAAARRRLRAPGALVWRDGAGLATLDQITPALLDALPDGVRLVVTVDETLLTTWFPDPGTAPLLTAPGTLVRLDPPDGGTGSPARVRALMTPVGWTSLRPLALVRAATDALRLELFDDAVLAHLYRHHAAALGAEAPDATGVRARCDALVGEPAVHGLPLLRRRGPVFLPPPGATLLADDGSSAAWATPDLTALAGVLTDGECDRAARRLLLRGDHDGVVALVGDGWGHPTPEQAAQLRRRVGRATPVWTALALGSSRRADVVDARLVSAQFARDPAARRAHYVAVAGDSSMARFRLAELDVGTGDDTSAREHLLTAVDGDRDVRVSAMLLLGEVERRAGDTAGARTWFERVCATPGGGVTPEFLPTDLRSPQEKAADALRELDAQQARHETDRRRRDARRWRVACHDYARAVAALPPAMAAEDVDGAWEWMALAESTDAPEPYADKVRELAVLLDDLTRRRADADEAARRRRRCDERAGELRRGHAATLDAELAREEQLVPASVPLPDDAPA